MLTIGAEPHLGMAYYVLEPQLHVGKKLPMWQSSACHGQHMGNSMDHSITVVNILNLLTEFVSPNII